jgi:hypothetical protein
LDSFGSEQGSLAGFHKGRNELQGYVKDGQFFEKLSNYYQHRKDSAPGSYENLIKDV